MGTPDDASLNQQLPSEEALRIVEESESVIRGSVAHDAHQQIESVTGITLMEIRPAEQRDAAEVHVGNFDINELWNFTSMGVAIRRADLDGRPIVLTKQQFFELDGELIVRYANGEDYTFEIDSVSDAGITILPEDLAD